VRTHGDSSVGSRYARPIYVMGVDMSVC